MGDELYTPQDVLSSATWNTGLNLTDYESLYRWSTAYPAEFWSEIWDETNIIGDKGTHVCDVSIGIEHNPDWFSEARLNWAENMLQRRDQKLALIEATEPTSLNPTLQFRRFTYSQLYDLVARLVSALLANGVKPGDRVGAYSSNTIETAALCLATTAIGAIWVIGSAGQGVLERFEQVQCAIIFAVDAVVYNAKVHDNLGKFSTLLSGLKSKPKVVIMHLDSYPEERSAWREGWVSWQDFILQGDAAKLGRDASGEIEWYRASFNYPLWILFSSGSTGEPTAIVHRAGGMLLQAKKELAICGHLQPTDVFFYYTMPGWMMYNFLLAGLSVGCTLVLYDGSPLRDPAFLWALTDELKISIFGTSAKYIEQLAKVYQPRSHHSLSSLRHIYSTGSPLSAALFRYVYEHIHPNVLLGSITGSYSCIFISLHSILAGGTDICSLFAGMNSALPVYAGEIQCRMLGLAVESYSETGTLSPLDEPGELVCLRPFPCMPVGFWPLPGFGTDEEVAAAKQRYHDTYFSEYEGVWYHGDHIIVTRSRSGNGGGLIMLGRSDGVLFRFGSAELYDVIDSAFCATGQLVDCLAVGQSIGGSDERVVLFVKLPDNARLSPELERRIKEEIRVQRSPRHVPAVVMQVTDIPYTLNGKRVEVLVKKIVNGAPLSIVNLSTLSNPECLPLYSEIGRKLRENV
ncbi:acetoacetyl-CoA synthetase [Roridomyces roridus]|uniref:Acetoacetyl-CoA synthetase n=1 Tax=Roridomyces roridus TaxID=1738132 RepID=A0AAD7FV09_9AGAR|nr:acetoacetyl-CoA synthetase [Roridomyces roridus]